MTVFKVVIQFILYHQIIRVNHGFVPYDLYVNITLSYNSSYSPINNVVSEGFHRQKGNVEESYDFIVIGSGPAGSVVANRLSENPNWTVLLLEVGKEPTILTEIPVIAGYFLFTDYNWGYLMEKQDNIGLGLIVKRMHWPRGKVLGGSSVINGMINIRGNRLDFDRWAKKGNKGWSYEEVLPYFKKSENYLVKIQDSEYHQKGGYLGVEDVAYRSRSADAFVKAMRELGYEYVDYNGRHQIGVSYVHSTTRRGRRCSAFNSFLEPVRHRRNLKIYTGARVTKVLIDETKRAWGVNYVKDKRNYVAKASKEVILLAGALNSPQILMLSGIGPEEHLRELGIPLVRDLPVGQKLYDHLSFFGLVFTTNESITIEYSEANSLKALHEYARGEGILTSLSGIEALAILRTSQSADPNPSYPDVEFIFFGAAIQVDRGDVFRKALRISQEIYDAVWKPLEGRSAFTILPMPYHPKSCGYMRLRSKNPYHRPKFYGNYFTDPENFDVKTFVAAIRIAQKLVEMPAFKRYDAKLVDTPVPGCEHHEYDSDIYWECALRHLSATVHHQVATCKMGPKSDPDAVVGDDLKVRDISRLRVADTSIIPEPMTAHTNIPSFMIGEKAADLIKDYWTKN